MRAWVWGAGEWEKPRGPNEQNGEVGGRVQRPHATMSHSQDVKYFFLKSAEQNVTKNPRE